jgi:hypothetical protein
LSIRGLSGLALIGPGKDKNAEAKAADIAGNDERTGKDLMRGRMKDHGNERMIVLGKSPQTGRSQIGGKSG